jgi:tetratricopeptide (TPR) repeat protein
VPTPPLEKQIAAATRSVEDSRRVVHRDPSRLHELVAHIHVLAELRQQEGDLRKAESLYRDALFRIQDARLSEPGLIFGVHAALAHLYDRWNKPVDAASFYLKALDLAQSGGGLDARKVATLKNNLAVLLKHAQEFEKAQRYYEEALDGFRGAEGGDSLAVAAVCNNLGVLFYQNLEVERALEMLLASYRIREVASPLELDQADLWQTCMNLSGVYKALGDFQSAQKFVEKARMLNLASPTAAFALPRTLVLDRFV